MQAIKGSIATLLLPAAVFITCCLAQETRISPQTTAIQNAKIQKAPKGLEVEKCGTLNDLAQRVEVCAKPLMDILQGSVRNWPRNENDAQHLCSEFAGSERCIRDAARKCAKGIQKTIISTIANSILRVRKRECNTQSKLAAIVRLTSCLEKHQDTMNIFMANATGILDAIETQTPNADKRLMSVCCIIGDIESEIKRTLNPFCPNEAAHIVRLYRSVLEDVIELICRAPKCKDYMKGYKYKLSENFSGIIAVILRIVFSLELD